MPVVSVKKESSNRNTVRDQKNFNKYIDSDQVKYKTRVS